VLRADRAIAAVGPSLAPASGDAEVIDAAGRLVIPGMVDTHRHVWQGAIGGYTPKITGVGYGPAVLTGISMRHSPDHVYAGTLWGALQALDAGITTIADWAGPADVETVIVGGDIVKRDGELVGDRAGHALELMHATRQHLRA
jgi:cytosine/adenosine deaminase-related metal-dependent hydrolase